MVAEFVYCVDFRGAQIINGVVLGGGGCVARRFNCETKRLRGRCVLMSGVEWRG